MNTAVLLPFASLRLCFTPSYSAVVTFAVQNPSVYSVVKLFVFSSHPPGSAST